MINLKDNLVTLGIIVFVIIFSLGFLFLQSNKDLPSDEFVKCLGNSSVLYLQDGCSHCNVQKEKFGDKIEFLTIVDCTEEPEKCIEVNINSVPTWVFEEITLRGVQSIGELNNITRCNY